MDDQPKVPTCPWYPDRAPAREGPGMKCPRCHQDNPSHAKFCLECGTPVQGATAGAKPSAEATDEVERLRRSLGESLEQQTATSEILRVIASSATDLQPVMAAVAENAARLCGANDAMILRVEHNVLHPAAVFGHMPSVSIPLSRRSPGG